MSSGFTLFLAVCTVVGAMGTLKPTRLLCRKLLGNEGRVRRRARRMGIVDPDVLDDPELLALVVRQPKGWETSIVELGLRREIERARTFKESIDLNLPPVHRQPLDSDLGRRYIIRKNEDLVRLIEATQTLFHIDLPDALAREVDDLDPRPLMDVCRRVGATYRAALDWTREIREHTFGEDVAGIVEKLAPAGLEVAEAIEDVADQTWRELQTALSPATRSPGPQKIKISVSLGTESLDAALEEIGRYNAQANP